MTDQEPGFLVEGETYPIPTLDSFDMDEAQILYDYAGVVLEDFAPAHPEADEEERKRIEDEQLRMVRNPAFKRALVHIAYVRGNPDARRDDVEKIVGKSNLIDVTLVLYGGDEESPPEMNSLSEPSQQQPSSELSRSEASGSLSTNGSDRPDETLEPTGTIESDTSSQESALTT